MTPTSTGFTVTFASPVNDQRPQPLRRRGARTAPPTPPWSGSDTGPVTGSLVVSPDGKTVTFIKTAGLLAPDTYTLTLVSGANAFQSTIRRPARRRRQRRSGEQPDVHVHRQPPGEQRRGRQHPQLRPRLRPGGQRPRLGEHRPADHAQHRPERVGRRPDDPLQPRPADASAASPRPSRAPSRRSTSTPPASPS